MDFELPLCVRMPTGGRGAKPPPALAAAVVITARLQVWNENTVMDDLVGSADLDLRLPLPNAIPRAERAGGGGVEEAVALRCELQPGGGIEFTAAICSAEMNMRSAEL